MSVLEAKKKELANESEEKINEMNRRRQLLESKLRELEAMNRDIEKFEESGIEDKLEVCGNSAKAKAKFVDLFPVNAIYIKFLVPEK